MGLDASVRCRCWEEGNAAPFEFPDLLKLGDDGWLTLSVPSEPKYDAVGRAFFQWLDSCCPHPGTRLTSERIGNWSEMSDFREALREAGEPRFATLLQEIPTRNGGQTSPLEAQRCLSELEEFMSAPPFGRRIWIVDSADGQRLHNPMPHGGVWSYNPEKKRSFFREMEQPAYRSRCRGHICASPSGRKGRGRSASPCAVD
jgi:hypothetical protein